MPESQFNLDKMADWYAKRHLKTDPGIREVLYLPANAPGREIRLLEINELIPERTDDPLEPIDFGVDIDSPSAHTLLVLDVTPSQWDRIKAKKLRLPKGWSLNQKTRFVR